MLSGIGIERVGLEPREPSVPRITGGRATMRPRGITYAAARKTVLAGGLPTFDL